MQSLHESIRRVLSEDPIQLNNPIYAGIEYAHMPQTGGPLYPPQYTKPYGGYGVGVGAGRPRFGNFPLGGGVAGPAGYGSIPPMWDYSRRGSPLFPNRDTQITPRRLTNPSNVVETRPPLPGRRGYGRRQQTNRSPYQYDFTQSNLPRYGYRTANQSTGEQFANWAGGNPRNQTGEGLADFLNRF